MIVFKNPSDVHFSRLLVRRQKSAESQLHFSSMVLSIVRRGRTLVDEDIDAEEGATPSHSQDDSR